MDAQEIARKYFDLSNQADLVSIKDLIHPQATYSSDNTGLYYARDSIMHMMQQFFSAHQSLHWQIDSLKSLGDHVIEIEFTCAFATADDQGKRRGIERIVAADGLIRHIEVRAINS